MKKIFVAISLACSSALAFAQDPQFLASGISAIQCGEVVSKPAGRYEVSSWMLGYTFGVRFHSPKSFDLPKESTAWLWINTYCKRNPTHFLFQGTAALVEELGGPKSPHQWHR